MNLLLTQLNNKIFSANKSVATPIYKNLKIGTMLTIYMVNLEKSKVKTEKFSGKILRLRRNGLLTRVEILIKTSTMSCLKTVYIHSPLVTRIEFI